MKYLFFILIALSLLSASCKKDDPVSPATEKKWEKINFPADVYPKCLLVYGNDLFAGCDSGIYISHDNGSTWSLINTQLNNLYVGVLVSNGNVIYAGTGYHYERGDIFVSSDAGVNWTNITAGQSFKSILSMGIKDNLIYAGPYNMGVFVSSDNGTTWHERNTGLNWGKVPQSILLYEDKILLGTEFPLYFSSDSGLNWSLAHNESSIRALTFFNNEFYAGTGTGGVCKSSKADTGWYKSNNGFPSTPSIYSFASDGNKLYAAASRKGVYFTSDNGNNWSAINEGLPDQISFSFLAIKQNYLFSIASPTIYKRTLN